MSLIFSDVLATNYYASHYGGRKCQTFGERWDRKKLEQRPFLYTNQRAITIFERIDSCCSCGIWQLFFFLVTCSLSLKQEKSLFLQWILWSAIGWHIMLIRWHFCLYLSEILTIIYVNQCYWVLLRFTGFRAICSQICSQKCSQIFRINKGFVDDLKLYVVVKNDCKRKHKH